MPLSANSRAWFIRLCFGVVGAIALILGIIGIFLPLLPTTPFVLLAAACFAKASPRVEAWLLAHKTFGPMILAWRDKGAIARGAKVAACLGMALGFAVFLYASHPAPWLVAVVAVGLLSVAAFIISRPE